MQSFQSKELILLTGAGFSKDLGGYLSGEMWSKIFNHPKLHTSVELVNALRGDFDFEHVYTSVTGNSATTENDRKLLNDAVGDAYASLDQSEIDYLGQGDSYATQRLKRFVEQILHGNRDEKALWFTLNQDLLIERLWDGQKKALGTPSFSSDIYQMKRALTTQEFVKLGSNTDDATREFSEAAQFHYLKLHGSFGWWASYTESSAPQMVIGTSKEDFINKEPILKFYYELFRAALNKKQRKLLIVGYGFKDDHINKIILEAARDRGAALQIFVVAPSSPKRFSEEHVDLWQYVSGYFPYIVSELFPDRDQVDKPSQPLQEILNAIQISNI